MGTYKIHWFSGKQGYSFVQAASESEALRKAVAGEDTDFEEYDILQDWTVDFAELMDE